MGKPVNLAGVRAAKEGAKAVKPGGKPLSGNDNQAAEGTLPPDCPVRPLGKDGKVRYYLDADRQLIALADRDHSRLGILGLFGKRSELLYGYWPRHNKDGDVTGWRPELASENLMAACSEQGVWDAKERQRGRGAWPGDDGELVLHTGSHVMVFPPTSNPYRDHHSAPAGLVGRYVYSAAASVNVPDAEAVPAGVGSPADTLLTLLRTWRWRRGEMDAVLLLGWIGAAMIGGALHWRPMVWLSKLNASELAEAEDNQRDEDRCLAHLLSSPVDVFRSGTRRTVGEWIRQAAGVEPEMDDVVDTAKRVLGTYGLKVVDPQPADGEHPAQAMQLAVANQHKGLAPLFAESHWKGTAGTMGVWVQALRRLPGASRARKALYIGGSTCKAVLVPMSVVLPLDSVDPGFHDRLMRRG